MISVCIATYNGEKYLKEQLDSLVNQTIPPYEVILQDDCSSDNTVEIAKQYTDKLNLKIYVNEVNLGFTKNFESVISKASGDFIAPCDQDDIWREDKLETLLRNIGDSSLIYSDSMLIDENGKSFETRFSSVLNKNFISSAEALNFLNDNSVSAHAMLFKKHLLNHIFPFPQNTFFDQWIAANAAALNGVNYYDDCLVEYRQHDNNTLSNHVKKKPNKKKLSLKDRNFSLINQKVLMIDDFLRIPLLSEANKSLLNNLKAEYIAKKESWICLKLITLLKKNIDILYPITKKNRLRLILKEIIGLKIYKALS